MASIDHGEGKTRRGVKTRREGKTRRGRWASFDDAWPGGRVARGARVDPMLVKFRPREQYQIWPI